MKIRVMLFIVEGPSDKATIIPWIEKEFAELKIKVKVKMVHGDILTKYVRETEEFTTTSHNVRD